MCNDKVNYNHQHKYTGSWISCSADGHLTVGDLRDAIAEWPDDTQISFGVCNCGEPMKFYRFKKRGDDVLGIEFG